MDFRKELNKIELEVNKTLSKLLEENVGLRFLSKKDIQEQNFGDIFEFRNEFTGNVHNFLPVSIVKGGELEAVDENGEKIDGDPVSMNQLSIEDKISLIDLIKEKI